MEEKRVESRVPYRLRLFTALYFHVFYYTVERGDIISRELDASAKRETWSSFISLPSPPLRASRSLFLSRTLKNGKVVNSLPGRALVCSFFSALVYDRLAPLVRR